MRQVELLNGRKVSLDKHILFDGGDNVKINAQMGHLLAQLRQDKDRQIIAYVDGMSSFSIIHPNFDPTRDTLVDFLGLCACSPLHHAKQIIDDYTQGVPFEKNTCGTIFLTGGAGYETDTLHELLLHELTKPWILGVKKSPLTIVLHQASVQYKFLAQALGFMAKTSFTQVSVIASTQDGEVAGNTLNPGIHRFGTIVM